MMRDRMAFRALAAFFMLIGALLALPSLAQGHNHSHAHTRPPVYTAPKAALLPKDTPYLGVIKVHADVTDLERRIFHITQTIPLSKAGEFSLLLPEWLPGKHHPHMRQINRIAGLHFSANGKPLYWKRDPLNVYRFTVTIPPKATLLTVKFNYLAPIQATTGRIVMTSDLMNFQWEMASLYPEGHYVSNIRIQPSLTLPKEWQAGSALKILSVDANNKVSFEETSYETLIDSPIFAGRYFKRLTLTEESAKQPVTVAAIADGPEQLIVSEEALKAHKKLIKQADKLFGSFPFDRYEFLVAASEKLGGIGLEHHRSSENRVNMKHFTDWKGAFVGRDLLPHELVHSWNGKHKRPDLLWTPSYDVPMQDTLLWVYEGQTDYWGTVLAARSDFLTKDHALDMFAITAAYLENIPGRSWRPLEDTTYDPAIIGRTLPRQWPSFQRNEDYYDEGTLMWLDADTLIREKTGGKKSLDDFAKAFFGGKDGDYRVYTYNKDDVVAVLTKVVAHDWAGFLDDHLTSKTRSPLEGIRRGGYRLVFKETPNTYMAAQEATSKALNLSYSLGFSVGSDMVISSVWWEGPAFKENLVPGTQIISVDGKQASTAGLKAAITRAKADKKPIELIIKNEERYRTLNISYDEGLKYPHLERISDKPALLDQILSEKK